eukprot:SAG11_NODE_1925_length_4056_cov_3.841547_4_plen_86_part_00
MLPQAAGVISLWWLLHFPNLEIAPPHPRKSEERHVRIGAVEPLMQEHMVLVRSIVLIRWCQEDLLVPTTISFVAGYGDRRGLSHD